MAEGVSEQLTSSSTSRRSLSLSSSSVSDLEVLRIEERDLPPPIAPK